MEVTWMAYQSWVALWWWRIWLCIPEDILDGIFVHPPLVSCIRTCTVIHRIGMLGRLSSPSWQQDRPWQTLLSREVTLSSSWSLLWPPWLCWWIHYESFSRREELIHDWKETMGERHTCMRPVKVMLECIGAWYQGIGRYFSLVYFTPFFLIRFVMLCNRQHIWAFKYDLFMH